MFCKQGCVSRYAIIFIVLVLILGALAASWFVLNMDNSEGAYYKAPHTTLFMDQIKKIAGKQGAEIDIPPSIADVYVNPKLTVAQKMFALGVLKRKALKEELSQIAEKVRDLIREAGDKEGVEFGVMAYTIKRGAIDRIGEEVSLLANFISADQVLDSSLNELWKYQAALNANMSDIARAAKSLMLSERFENAFDEFSRTGKTERLLSYLRDAYTSTPSILGDRTDDYSNYPVVATTTILISMYWVALQKIHDTNDYGALMPIMLREFYKEKVAVDARPKVIFDVQADYVERFDNSRLIARVPIPKQKDGSNLPGSVFYIAGNEGEDHDWLVVPYSGYLLMPYAYNDYLVPLVGESYRASVYGGQDCVGTLTNSFFDLGVPYGNMDVNTAYLFLLLAKYGAATLNNTLPRSVTHVVLSDVLRINMLAVVNAIESGSRERIEETLAEFKGLSGRLEIYNMLYGKMLRKDAVTDGMPFIFSKQMVNTESLRTLIRKTVEVLEVTPKTSSRDIKSFAKDSNKIIGADVRYVTSHKFLIKNEIPRIIHAAVFVDAVQNNSGKTGLVFLSMQQEFTPLVSTYKAYLDYDDYYALGLAGAIDYDVFSPQVKEKVKSNKIYLLKMQ